MSATSSTPTQILYPTRDRSPSSAEACAPDGGWFDARRAARAVAWAETFCHHSTGELAGKPFLLDPHAKQLIEDVWGWRRAEDDTRLYRRVFDAEARKNGKTTRAAAIGLMLTIGDGEPGAQVYSIAGNEKQASLVFDEAKAMVEQSRALFKVCEPLAKVIYCPSLRARWRPLPSKAATQHGLNPHGVIGDEVHEWRGRDQYDVMKTALGARRQPLEFYITTAGSDLTSICWELWDYALKVRDGIHVDRGFLPIICAADPADDFGDPATWAKANPNLGRSVKMDFLRERYAEALIKPGDMLAFKRLYLNIWTEAHDKWMPISVWNDPANAAPFSAADLRGRPCWMGLDLAWKHDLSAMPIVFPPHGDDPNWYVINHFFLPEKDLSARAKRDRVPYDMWAQQGLLTLTPGDITDFDLIEDHAKRLFDQWKPKAMGFDRAFSGQVVNHLTDAGYPCVAVGQGFMTTAMPMAELDRAVHGRIFRHGGNPILAWMASNVVVQTDPAGNMKPDKKRSIQRIDGVPAMLNAIALALAARAEPANPYEHRGLIILGR